MQQEEIKQTSRHYRFLFGLLSLLLIGAGAYLSRIRYLDTEWLSRAGCLVVVLGIWSGLGGIIQEKIITSRLRVRHRMAELRLRRTLRRGGADAERIAQELEALDADSQAQIAALSEHLRLSVGIQEVTLLVIGTLLWGFGDLLIT